MFLQPPEERIIVSVSADEEPDDFVVFHHPDGSIVPTDANRVDRQSRMDLLEAESGVPGVGSEEPVAEAGLSSNLGR